MICRPDIITEDLSKLPPIDICILAIKSYDLDNVLYGIKDKIKDDTEIIPLLNGIDITDKIRKVITNGIVYPSCVYIGTHIEKSGVVTQNGGSCTIILGNEKDNATNNVKVLEVLDQSNINYKWTSNNYEEIWSKYMFIASYGLVTAAFNKTIGEVYEDKELSNKVLSIMKVIKKVSLKRNIGLSEDIVSISYNKAKDFPYDTRTSFQRDYESKKGKDERDIFGKSLIEMAERYKIDYKVVDEIYRRL